MISLKIKNKNNENKLNKNSTSRLNFKKNPVIVINSGMNHETDQTSWFEMSQENESRNKAKYKKLSDEQSHINENNHTIF